MKNLRKIFTLTFIILLGFTLNSFAQVTGSANASATIITPISITKTSDMNFGNVAVKVDQAGTVLMGTDGVRTPTGGVTLPATAGSPAFAGFAVAGQVDYTYSISLPVSIIVSAGGGKNMTVDNFISNPATTGTLDGTGNQAIAVGATLNVEANQGTGIYNQTTTIDVTVNYN